MQHISLDIIKEFNQTNNHTDPDEDCLPEGKSYGDNDSDSLPDPDQTVTAPVYDPYDDPDSPYFKLADYKSEPEDVLSPESLQKTLRGVIVDDVGWCTTDIPEGSELVAGDVIERTATDEPLPYNDESDFFEPDDDEQLPFEEDYKF